MKPMAIIAIDPGKSGAIAVFRHGEIIVDKMPYGAKEFYAYLQNAISLEPRLMVYIERVQLIQKDIDVPGKAFNIQKMLNHYREMITVMEMMRMRYVEVPPMKWMKALLVYKKGEERPDRKRRLKEIAKKRFAAHDHIKVSLVNCDALLILCYAALQKGFNRAQLTE